MTAEKIEDVIVIGGGLFGQIIAAGLRAQGRHVRVFDSEEPNAGSKPAACLMKPSWFSSMGKDVYEPSLRLLQDLYGVHDVEFVTQPKLLRATVHWINPRAVLTAETERYQVRKIERHDSYWRLTCSSGNWTFHHFNARLVVVAAGIWTGHLLPQYRQVGQRGVAFLWPGHTLHQPFIRPWAPYRQLVAFNRGDGIWLGDGTAIKDENWTKERERDSLDRCRNALVRALEAQEDTDLRLRDQPPPIALHGIRPYAKGRKPCLLEEVEPGLWVASGGAKNGTMAAGYCAHVIRERTS